MNILKKLFGKKDKENKVKQYFKTGLFNKFIATLVTVCFVISIVNLPAFADKKKKVDEIIEEDTKAQEVLNGGDKTSDSVRIMQSLADNVDLKENVIWKKGKDGKKEVVGTWDGKVAKIWSGGKFVEDEAYTKAIKAKLGIQSDDDEQATKPEENDTDILAADIELQTATDFFGMLGDNTKNIFENYVQKSPFMAVVGFLVGKIVSFLSNNDNKINNGENELKVSPKDVDRALYNIFKSYIDEDSFTSEVESVTTEPKNEANENQAKVEVKPEEQQVMVKADMQKVVEMVENFLNENPGHVGEAIARKFLEKAKEGFNNDNNGDTFDYKKTKQYQSLSDEQKQAIDNKVNELLSEGSLLERVKAIIAENPQKYPKLNEALQKFEEEEKAKGQAQIQPQIEEEQTNLNKQDDNLQQSQELSNEKGQEYEEKINRTIKLFMDLVKEKQDDSSQEEDQITKEIKQDYGESGYKALKALTDKANSEREEGEPEITLEQVYNEFKKAGVTKQDLDKNKAAETIINQLNSGTEIVNSDAVALAEYTNTSKVMAAIQLIAADVAARVYALNNKAENNIIKTSVSSLSSIASKIVSEIASLVKKEPSIDDKIKQEYGEKNYKTLKAITDKLNSERKDGEPKITLEEVYNIFKEQGVTKEDLEKASEVLLSQISNGARIMNCSAGSLASYLGISEMIAAVQQLSVDIATGTFLMNNKKGDKQIKTSMEAQQKVCEINGKSSKGYKCNFDDFVASLNPGESAIVWVNGDHYITVNKKEDGSFGVTDINVNNGKEVIYSEKEFRKLMNNEKAVGRDAKTGKKVECKGYKATDENGNVTVLTDSKSVAKKGKELSKEQMKEIAGASHTETVTETVKVHIVETFTVSFTVSVDVEILPGIYISFSFEISFDVTIEYDVEIEVTYEVEVPDEEDLTEEQQQLPEEEKQELLEELRQQAIEEERQRIQEQIDRDQTPDYIQEQIDAQRQDPNSDFNKKLQEQLNNPNSDIMKQIQEQLANPNSDIMKQIQDRIQEQLKDPSSSLLQQIQKQLPNGVNIDLGNINIKINDINLQNIKVKDDKTLNASQLPDGYTLGKDSGGNQTITDTNGNTVNVKDFNSPADAIKTLQRANELGGTVDSDGNIKLSNDQVISKTDILNDDSYKEIKGLWDEAKNLPNSKDIKLEKPANSNGSWGVSGPGIKGIQTYSDIVNSDRGLKGFFSDVATAQKSDSDLKVGVEKNPSNGKGTVYFYGNNLSNNHRISSQDIHNSVKQSGLTMSDFATAYKQANSSNTDLKVGIKNGQLAFFGKHIYGGVQLVSSIVSGGGAKALANYGQAYKVAFDNKITLGYDKTWNNFVFYDSKQHMETGRVNINAGNSNAIAAFGNRYKAVLASGTDVKFTEDGKHLVGKNIDGKIDITTGIFANGDTNISKLKEFLNYYKQLEGTDLKIRQQMGNGGSWNDHFNVVGGNIVNAKGEAGCASWNSVFDGKGKTGFIAQYKLIQGGDTNICVGNGGVPTGYYDSKSKSMLKDGSGNNISYKTDTDTLSILKEKRVQECRNKSNSVDMNDPKQIKEFFEFCGYNPDLIFQACDTNGDGKLTGNEAKKYDDLYTNGDDSIYNHDDTTHDQHRLAEGRRSYINDSENSDIFPGKNVDEKYSSLTIDGSGAIIDSNGNGYMPVIVTDKGNDTGEVGKVEMRTFDASTSSVIHGPYGDSVVYGYVTEIDNGKGESVPIIRRDFTGDHAGESIGFLMDDRSSIFEQGSDGSNGSGSGGGSMQSVLTAGVIKGNDKDGWTLSGAGSYFSIVDGEAKIIGNGTRALEGSEIGLTATDAEGNEHSSTVRVTSNSCYVFTENGWESDTGESSFEFLGTPEENRAFVEASFYQATGDQIKDGELDNFNFTGTYKGSFYNVAGIMNQEGVKSFIVEGFYGADGKDGPKALESTTFEVSVVDINGGMFSFKCTQDTEFAVPEDYIDDIGSETFTIEEGGYATMAYYLAQHPEKTITVNGEELSGSAVYSEYGQDNKPAEGAVVVGYMYSLNKPITCTSENGYISQDVLDQTKGDVKWEKGSLVSVDFGKGTFSVTVGVLSVDGLTLSAEEFNKLTGNKGDGEEENQEQNEQDKGIINLNPFFKSAGITQEGNNVKISGTFYCVSGNTTVNGLVAALYAPKSTLNKEDLTPGGADVDKVDESGKPTGEKTGSSKFDNEVTVGKNGEWEINDAKFEWNWDLFDPNSENSKKFNNYLGFTGGQIYAGVESLVINSPIVVLADFVNTKVFGNESFIEGREREITRLAYGVDTTNQEYAAESTQKVFVVSAVVAAAIAIEVATLGMATPAVLTLTTGLIFATKVAVAATSVYFAYVAANDCYDTYKAWQKGEASTLDFAKSLGILALTFVPGAGTLLREAGAVAKMSKFMEGSSLLSKGINYNIKFMNSGKWIGKILGNYEGQFVSMFTKEGQRMLDITLEGGADASLKMAGEGINLTQGAVTNITVGSVIRGAGLLVFNIAESGLAMARIGIEFNIINKYLISPLADLVEGKDGNGILHFMKQGLGGDIDNVFEVNLASSFEFGIIMMLTMPLAQGVFSPLLENSRYASFSNRLSGANELMSEEMTASNYLKGTVKSKAYGLYDFTIKRQALTTVLTAIGIPPELAQQLSFLILPGGAGPGEAKEFRNAETAKEISKIDFSPKGIEKTFNKLGIEVDSVKVTGDNLRNMKEGEVIKVEYSGKEYEFKDIKDVQNFAVTSEIIRNTKVGSDLNIEFSELHEIIKDLSERTIKEGSVAEDFERLLNVCATEAFFKDVKAIKETVDGIKGNEGNGRREALVRREIGKEGEGLERTLTVSKIASHYTSIFSSKGLTDQAKSIILDKLFEYGEFIEDGNFVFDTKKELMETENGKFSNFEDVILILNLSSISPEIANMFKLKEVKGEIEKYKENIDKKEVSDNLYSNDKTIQENANEIFKQISILSSYTEFTGIEFKEVLSDIIDGITESPMAEINEIRNELILQNNSGLSGMSVEQIKEILLKEILSPKEMEKLTAEAKEKYTKKYEKEYNEYVDKLIIEKYKLDTAEVQAKLSGYDMKKLVEAKKKELTPEENRQLREDFINEKEKQWSDTTLNLQNTLRSTGNMDLVTGKLKNKLANSSLAEKTVENKGKTVAERIMIDFDNANYLLDLGVLVNTEQAIGSLLAIESIKQIETEDVFRHIEDLGIDLENINLKLDLLIETAKQEGVSYEKISKLKQLQEKINSLQQKLKAETKQVETGKEVDIKGAYDLSNAIREGKTDKNIDTKIKNKKGELKRAGFDIDYLEGDIKILDIKQKINELDKKYESTKDEKVKKQRDLLQEYESLIKVKGYNLTSYFNSNKSLFNKDKMEDVNDLSNDIKDIKLNDIIDNPDNYKNISFNKEGIVEINNKKYVLKESLDFFVRNDSGIDCCRNILDAFEKLNTELNNMEGGKTNKNIEELLKNVKATEVFTDAFRTNMEYDDYLINQKKALIDIYSEIAKGGNYTRFIEKLQTGGGKTVITALTAAMLYAKQGKIELNGEFNKFLTVLTNNSTNANELALELNRTLGLEAEEVKHITAEESNQNIEIGDKVKIVVVDYQTYNGLVAGEFSRMFETKPGELEELCSDIGADLSKTAEGKLEFSDPYQANIVFKLLRGDYKDIKELKQACEDKGLKFNEVEKLQKEFKDMGEELLENSPLKRLGDAVCDEVDTFASIAQQALAKSNGMYITTKSMAKYYDTIKEMKDLNKSSAEYKDKYNKLLNDYVDLSSNLEKMIDTDLKRTRGELDNLISKYENCKNNEIPESASPEIRAAIEKGNKYVSYFEMLTNGKFKMNSKGKIESIEIIDPAKEDLSTLEEMSKIEHDNKIGDVTTKVDKESSSSGLEKGNDIHSIIDDTIKDSKKDDFNSEKKKNKNDSEKNNNSNKEDRENTIKAIADKMYEEYGKDLGFSKKQCLEHVRNVMSSFDLVEFRDYKELDGEICVIYGSKDAPDMTMPAGQMQALEIRKNLSVTKPSSDSYVSNSVFAMSLFGDIIGVSGTVSKASEVNVLNKMGFEIKGTTPKLNTLSGIVESANNRTDVIFDSTNAIRENQGQSVFNLVLTAHSADAKMTYEGIIERTLGREISSDNMGQIIEANAEVSPIVNELLNCKTVEELKSKVSKIPEKYRPEIINNSELDFDIIKAETIVDLKAKAIMDKLSVDISFEESRNLATMKYVDSGISEAELNLLKYEVKAGVYDYVISDATLIGRGWDAGNMIDAQKVFNYRNGIEKGKVVANNWLLDSALMTETQLVQGAGRTDPYGSNRFSKESYDKQVIQLHSVERMIEIDTLREAAKENKGWDIDLVNRHMEEVQMENERRELQGAGLKMQRSRIDNFNESKRSEAKPTVESLYNKVSGKYNFAKDDPIIKEIVGDSENSDTLTNQQWFAVDNYKYLLALGYQYNDYDKEKVLKMVSSGNIADMLEIVGYEEQANAVREYEKAYKDAVNKQMSMSEEDKNFADKFGRIQTENKTDFIKALPSIIPVVIKNPIKTVNFLITGDLAKSEKMLQKKEKVFNDVKENAFLSFVKGEYDTSDNNLDMSMTSALIKSDFSNKESNSISLNNALVATLQVKDGVVSFADDEIIEIFEELFSHETEETKNLSGWKNFDYNRFIELYKSGNKDEMLNMLKQADLENSKLYEKILSDNGIKKSTVEEVKTAAEEKGIFTNTNIENKFNKNLTTEQQILLGFTILSFTTNGIAVALPLLNMIEVSLQTDNADEVVTTLAEVANVDVNEFKDETGKYDLAKVMNVVQASLINNAEEVITTLAEAANVDVNKLKDENGKYDLAKVVDMLQTLQSEEIVTSGIKGETISTVYSLCKLLKKQEGKISQEKLKQAVARYQNSKSLTNITDILIDTLDNIDADGKELVKALTGVTKPEEMQHAIAAVIAICQDADGIARLLGFDNIADVANVKNNEEIVNRFMLEVSEVADYEYAQEDKIATILLLSAARDILIAYNNKEIDEETINNGTIEDIQVAIQLSKAVNMNVIVKGLADAVVNKKVTIEDEEFKIDLVALQEAVTDKVKIKSILKNAKDSLKDLGNLGRGMATEKDLPDSLKALMNISDVHAVAASA